MTATPGSAPPPDEPPDERAHELAANLARVEERVVAACSGSGRARREVTVVVVTKTFPAADVVRLARLGVREVAENRDQEASAKVAEVAEALGGQSSPRWHFVGQLQRNKARSVARYADVVQSVDRMPLVRALDAAALDMARSLEVLLQVSLDPTAAGRGGAAADDVLPLAEAVASSRALVLRGVMAVAPLGQDPTSAFDRLVAVAGRLRAEHPGASWVSAGMSGDLEAAVAAGATHLRVGSAVLGSRPSLR